MAVVGGSAVLWFSLRERPFLKIGHVPPKRDAFIVGEGKALEELRF